MLYHAPTGSTDPNAGYVGKNVGAGQQGSKVPPAAIETTQREIVAAIVEAGLAPTDTDLKQLMRAIQSGQLNVFADQGTPNAIILTPLTPLAAYVPGLPICIKLASTITAATTVNVSGLGVIPVTFPGGGPLQRFDFLAGDLIVGRINSAGTGLVVHSPISNSLIDTGVTMSVHGAGAAFANLNAAFAWLNRRRIASTGSVTFQVAAGVNANKLAYASSVSFQHADGSRVTVKGQPLSGALPAGSALTYTGSGTSARLADTTQNLATLRNVYSTEIAFSGAAGFFGTGAIGNIQDILFTFDGTAGSDGVAWDNGSCKLTRVAAVGAGGRGIVAGSSFLSTSGSVYALGNGAGVSIGDGAVLSLGDASQLVSMSNTQVGVLAQSSRIAPSNTAALTTSSIYCRGNGDTGMLAISGQVSASAASVSRDNGSHGWWAVQGGVIVANATLSSGNGGHAYIATGLASLNAANTTGTGNTGFGYYASDGSNVMRTSGAAAGGQGSASPAVGVVGNNNAFIS